MVVRDCRVVGLNERVLQPAEDVDQRVDWAPVDKLGDCDLEGVGVDVRVEDATVVVELGWLYAVVVLDEHCDHEIDVFVQADTGSGPDLQCNEIILHTDIRVYLDNAVLIGDTEIDLAELHPDPSYLRFHNFIRYFPVPILYCSNFNHLPSQSSRYYNFRTLKHILLMLTPFFQLLSQYNFSHININIESMMNASDMMMSMTSKTEGKLGYTTTVKQQVDEIENNLQHFKKTLDSQRKQQNELEFQLRKLEQQTRTNFSELNKEIEDKVNYLNELFKTDTKNQNKEFDYLELQNSGLLGDHEKLGELTAMIGGRVQDVENAVGF